jgi:regulation of enolase protein 1 (concanavalin A-like superfamily)
MPGLQWRSIKGENTNTFDLPFDGPGKFKIRLVRLGVGLTVFMAKDGEELKQIARTEVTFRNPILVGLAVCSHKADASDTVVFSDVSIEQTTAQPPAKKQ